MLKHEVVLTTEQWRAIDELADEHIARYANWIAKDFQNPDKAEWLKSVKARYELWQDISHALLDCTDLIDEEVGE
jgi:hypothetical protein